MAVKKTTTTAAPVAEVKTAKATAISADVAAPVKKEAAPKKAAPAKAAEEKETAAVEKKAPVKKAPVKKEAVTKVFVEFAGTQTAMDEIVEKAKAAYVAAGHKAASIKTLEVYVKPEENAAYYVVNGEGSDDCKVTLY